MFTQAQQGISFEAMIEHQRGSLNDGQRAIPTLTFFSSVGAGGPGGAINTGIIFCHLMPRSQRKLSIDQIIDKWRGEFSTRFPA